MGLTNTRRVLKLILKPKPSFEITPSLPDQLFRVPPERTDYYAPDILWTTSPSSATRKSQPHVQETSFTFSSLNIGDEQDLNFDDILADHCSRLSSRVRQNVYSQMCLKSDQDNMIHDTSPTPTPRHRLRRVRRRFSSKSPDRDFCIQQTQASDVRQFATTIPFQSTIQQHPKAFSSQDRPETTFKHSNGDLSPITEGRETFASPGSLSTMFDSPVEPFAVSASRSTGKSSTASTTNVPFETAHYFPSQEPSFSSGQPGIYPARSSPKLNSANHSTSTAQSSPVSPLVFADVSSFPGQPLSCDVSHDLDVSDFPSYKGNIIITSDSRAHRSSNISAVMIGKAGRRLGLDALGAYRSNRDLARTINSRACTSETSTAKSIKAPVVDTVLSMSHDPCRPRAPRASPSKRIWSRLRHAVTRAFWMRSNVAGVEDSGGSKQGFRATHRISAPLLTTGASSVRDQDVTRQMRRLSKPARSASSSIVPDSKCGVSPLPKRLSKRPHPSNRTDIDFATIFSPSVLPA